MLEEFESTGRHKEKGVWPFAALIVQKSVRVFALYQGYSFLSSFNYPIFLYTYYVLVFSAIFLLAAQQPWNSKKQIKPKQWVQIGTFSVFLVIGQILFNFGLKYYTPLRTILATDYADITYAMMFSTVISMQGKGAADNKVKGLAALVIGYLLVFLVDPGSNDQSLQASVNTGYSFGLFSLSETTVGGICLYLSVCLSMLRKQIFVKSVGELGGAKRIYALAVALAALGMTPIATIQYFSSDIINTYSFFTTMAIMISIALFTVTSDFYVESLLHRLLDVATTIKLSLSTSLMAACALEVVRGLSNISTISFVSFGFILYGGHVGLSKKSSIDKELPIYGGANQKGGSLISMSFLKSSLNHILSHRDSRRIFIYLCINLCFMFVEALYGYLTNSLGLISDACHMLFDSTALVIGLFASVISNWEPNQFYSYGYGRVEVVSGFVNGIFLIFIAFAVLLESMERFFHPQEINTDMLLLVSCLGLVVNLIGVFAFHDLHGGGDHGGHSHSHGHSHGHGHGHSEEKPHKEHNSNLYGIYLHIIADTLGSVGVITSSLIISYFGYYTADPICSFCISLLIFVSVIPLLSGSSTTLLQCTPPEFEKKVQKCLDQVMAIEGVVSYRNPHFWQHCKDLIVGTVHVQIQPEAQHQKVLQQVQKVFKKKGVKNMTVEVTKE